jgi:hypothetical protein
MPIPFMYTINHPIHSFLFFSFFSFGSGGIHFTTYVTSSFIQQSMMVKVWKWNISYKW